MIILDREFVRQHLTYEACIPLMRAAMIALSRGETIQPLRSILKLADGHMFGIMPGAMGESGSFGAKLVSVFPENASLGRQSHQGVVLVFDAETGAPTGLVQAGEVTAIRTAAASAAATDALARPDAASLAILGCGEQAGTHLEAISKVRELKRVTVWGRSLIKAQSFAARMSRKTGLAVTASPTVQACVEDAGIICTVTAAQEPILKRDWVSRGAHINLVGSSYAGPAEIDTPLVVASRFIADYRPGVLAQGAEFLRAKEAGLIGDNHIHAEIGEVFDGKAEGRANRDDITAYKSLGHVVQDLASAAFLLERAGQLGMKPVSF
ncbi:ornithine cyclodeaminase/mu-crystallin family protein [Glycocaulis alkaliphilus]|uniref:Ornithine cyclodeaminase/mu-crystallin family protein n=1 Tax=Glycocaulis alkaliphilus TaxID=1434191 RepID=A0A3T0EB40_9PROT|nr:ornithine cyclodeaminase family protein [Glycocaulis alkaliphilus]AZU04695.1 ornithine cyclodeaminase/mu-crystallin family protein [Glycocaulis alkaliphilus]GGB68456.1 ornithine cyclodeaminase [Glycocaulis alkaliphilus]